MKTYLLTCDGELYEVDERNREAKAVWESGLFARYSVFLKPTENITLKDLEGIIRNSSTIKELIASLGEIGIMTWVNEGEAQDLIHFPYRVSDEDYMQRMYTIFSLKDNEIGYLNGNEIAKVCPCYITYKEGNRLVPIFFDEISKVEILDTKDFSHIAFKAGAEDYSYTKEAKELVFAK